MEDNNFILSFTDIIAITGSNGFIGSRVVENLLNYGFRHLRCLVRPSSNLTALERIIGRFPKAGIEIIKGNLQSREDCGRLVDGASIIYHLAAGRGEKSYPDAYMNTVITTRNLLDALVNRENFMRFVNVSSFTVYATEKLRGGGLLDESCKLEKSSHQRGEAYCYAKVKQEELLAEYGCRHNIPYVIVRPGVVYGPGNKGLTGRVGIGTFGLFLHLGGANLIPLTYVENCADAIVLAGLKKIADREVFNIVDDDPPTSRKLLGLYKRNVRSFASFYLPHVLSYMLCYAWEKYSEASQGQLPPVFNRKRWSGYWKGNRYSNEKLKKVLGWRQRVGFQEASERYFAYQRTV